MRIFMILLLFLTATGCEQAFRYPCQDPANWGNLECQRPICEVNRDCPDLIFKENSNIEIPKSSPPKGECK